MRKSALRKIISGISKTYFIIGGVVLLIATLLILSPLYPYIWFNINERALENELNNVTEFSNDVSENKSEDKSLDNKNTIPEVDQSLTTTNTLNIPSIGVLGAIHESANPDNGLKKGIWRVGEWGDPINNDFSIILAAHRFGYLTWTSQFRKLNSFQNLPKTKVGDRIEIIWEQRRFEYEIYKAEENTKITDYDADLIIYTCKTYNSAVRVFRYAKRIN